MKLCKHCNIEKPESEFTKKTSSKDGLYSWCRECSRKYQREIDSRPEEKAKKRNYYLQNKTIILKRGSEYRRKDGIRIKMNTYQRAYLQTDKGKAAESRSGHKSRMRFGKKKSDLTARQWGNIISLQNNRCAVCGIIFDIDNKATKDCIIPLNALGEFTYGNVQALCIRCNNKKGKSTVIPYLFDFLFSTKHL